MYKNLKAHLYLALTEKIFTPTLRGERAREDNRTLTIYPYITHLKFKKNCFLILNFGFTEIFLLYSLDKNRLGIINI